MDEQLDETSISWTEWNLWVLLISFTIYVLNDLGNYVQRLESSKRKEEELRKKFALLTQKSTTLQVASKPAKTAEEELRKKFENVALTERLDNQREKAER